MAKQWLVALLLIQLSANTSCRPTENAENDNICVESCKQRQDGDYQSCDGCHLFITCSSGETLKSGCAPGLVWDDHVKNCEMMSDTCGTDDSVEFVSMQNGMDKVNDYSLMPENFHLQFRIKDEDMLLNLTRNSHINADFPIYMAENGVLKKAVMPAEDMFAMYRDKETSASVIVHRNPADPEASDYLYEALFSMDGGEYFLQPTPVSSSNESSDIVEGPYMVRRMEPTDTNMEFGESEVRGTVAELTKDQDSVLNKAQESQALPQGLQNYEVEVLLFLDNAIYNKWYRLSKKTSSSEREAETVKNIRFYYSHVMNGVDLRYNSIEDSFMKISFKLNAMYIAKTAKDSPWTEYNRRDYSYTEAYDSLDDFEAWLTETRFNLPPFDLAALLTGYNLYNGQRADGSLRTIGGLADIKGACTYSPVFYGASISYENGIYGTTQTLTHEMGHNLGAYHDGDRRYAVECVGSDQYIMASAPGGVTDKNYKNGLKFSHCSIGNFQNYFTFLTMEDRNCLLTSATYPTDGEDTATQPGQVFLPDEQCQIIYGTGSYYCGGAPKDSLICREMWCYRADTGRCVFTSEQRAFEGTTCGNKMWCEKSDCVFHQQAPVSPDFCIYGDYKDPYQPSGQVCPEIIEERPWNCYREDYGNECCASCANIKDDTRKGCEYGDHSQCSNRESWHCYDQVTREDCCLFCDAFYDKDAIGCEYGNRGTQCDNIEDFHCYTQGDTCCATCAERKRDTLPTGCEYGDQQRWCRDIRRPHECYNGNDNICCETCNNLKTDDPACPYGDKRDSCRLDHCTNAQYNSTCCETCRYTSGTGVGTTPTTPTQKPTTSQPGSDSCTDKPKFNCPTIEQWDCYTFSETCCATCEQLYNDDQPGCEYGDKISWCANYVREWGTEVACQSEFVKTECCESCATMSMPTTTPDASDSCPQGNKASWCVEDSFFGGYCYNGQSKDTCCLACSQVKTGHPGCEYGDKSSWCADFVSEDMATVCKRPEVKDQCCLSCVGQGSEAEVVTDPVNNSPGCEYGDKYSWCTDFVSQDMATVCQRPEVKDKCCLSCVGQGSEAEVVTAPELKPKDCPKGDSASWCSGDVAENPGICYNPNTSMTCCASCSNYKTGPKDCAYGDKFSWCKPEHCDRDDYDKQKTDCCQTCAHLTQ